MEGLVGPRQPIALADKPPGQAAASYQAEDAVRHPVSIVNALLLRVIVALARHAVKHPVHVVNALLLIGIFAIPNIVSAARHQKALDHQSVLDRSFAKALSRYGSWTEGGWYKANLTDQWVKRDFGARGYPPIANPNFKYMAYAHKEPIPRRPPYASRAYQAVFNDGLADLVIEVGILQGDVDLPGPSPHDDAGRVVVMHYDGRSEKLDSSVELRDAAKLEIMQAADEMAEALRAVLINGQNKQK